MLPQLAAELPAFSDGGKTVTIKLRPGVKFNDGTPMNAEAVRFSLDRHLHMKGSNRRSEIELITAIEVVDPLTVRLKLKAPFAPLVATLADRAGMPVSPAQANKLGEKFGTAPVCVGPWSFVERVPQDRIVLEKSAHYFDPGQARFDKLIFRIIPDDNVRLANLRSGDIDFMHLVAPTDSGSLKKEGRFEVASVTGIGYSGITINLRNKTGKAPSRRQSRHAARERTACARGVDLSIAGRREQVACTAIHAGLHAIAPNSPFYDKSHKCRCGTWSRREKLSRRGPRGGYASRDHRQRSAQRRVVSRPGDGQGGRFNISLRPAEFAPPSAKATPEAPGVSNRVDGRVDPAPISTSSKSAGQPEHDAGVRRDDRALLNKAREVTDQAQRTALYKEAVDKLTGQQRNIVYLYHMNYIAAFPKSLKGYKAVPDGLIRLKGTSWN